MGDSREGICAVMMLKNENRFICHEDGRKPKYTMLEQCLRRISLIVEEVYIVDGNSSDGSKDIYEKYKGELITFIRYHDATEKFDEMYRGEMMLKAQERGMKWMIVLDGDEVYEDGATKWIHNFCDNTDNNELVVAKFHYINFWRSRTKYRTDKWSTSYFKRLFAVNKDLVMIGGKLHNYAFVYRGPKVNSTVEGRVVTAPVKCLHYGWADWEHRKAKTQRYINYHAEVYKIPLQKAAQIYASDIDEQGIKFENANPSWASEFRVGEIDY